MSDQNASEKPKETPTKKPLEEFLDKFTLAYGYAFLVFCGALYFHFYYNPFHIPIFRYLDLSEIAVSFLPIIIITTLFFGFFICGYSLVRLILQRFKRKVAFIGEFSRKIGPWENIWTVLLCFICAWYLYSSNSRLDKFSDAFQFKWYRDYVWYGFLVLTALLMIITTMQNRIISVIIIFVMAVVHESITDVKDTIDDAKRKNKTYTIILKDGDPIITDTAHYFVGRTNHYVFLFNSHERSYDDIPVERIKSISFKYIQSDAP